MTSYQNIEPMIWCELWAADEYTLFSDHFGSVDKVMTLMVVVWRGDYVSASLTTLIGGKVVTKSA